VLNVYPDTTQRVIGSKIMGNATREGVVELEVEMEEEFEEDAPVVFGPKNISIADKTLENGVVMLGKSIPIPPRNAKKRDPTKVYGEVPGVAVGTA
jgi:hypothetical protein